ncbi:hypothetical protein CC80DRAFT_47955 [Byssothecium circinans]|uniref:Uncharacterized protein n=1 Tax=Byssothecium circinans TaxID=147558 RepID=A0A6A5U912_9PLEO|nr:hypothetical protein CC80DRAFT_47955 [Byssothecium circinans]
MRSAIPTPNFTLIMTSTFASQTSQCRRSLCKQTSNISGREILSKDMLFWIVLLRENYLGTHTFACTGHCLHVTEVHLAALW